MKGILIFLTGMTAGAVIAMIVFGLLTMAKQADEAAGRMVDEALSEPFDERV